MDDIGLFDRRTASQFVAAQLRAEIQQGNLKPGGRLRQGEIAKRFQVSTTPVREAIALLQAQGLVRVDPHKGAVVFRPTAADLRHLYEIREVLEVWAVEKAITKCTPEVLDKLENLIDRMERTNDPLEWLDLNNRFHIVTYEPAGRPRLSRLIGDLRDASSAYIYLLLSHGENDPRPNREHRDITEAYRRADVKAAQQAVSNHMGHTVERVLELMAAEGTAEETG